MIGDYRLNGTVPSKMPAIDPGVRPQGPPGTGRPWLQSVTVFY